MTRSFFFRYVTNSFFWVSCSTCLLYLLTYILITVIVAILPSGFHHHSYALEFTPNKQSNSKNTPSLSLSESDRFQNIKPDQVIKFTLSTAIVYKNDYLSIVINLNTDQFSLYKKNLQFLPPSGIDITYINYPVSEKIIDPLSKENVEVFTNGNF